MSFILVVSETKIYGMMRIDSSVNSEIVIHSLKEFCKVRNIGALKDKPPLLYDLATHPSTPLLL